jgi:hypothetical protein
METSNVSHNVAIYFLQGVLASNAISHSAKLGEPLVTDLEQFVNYAIKVYNTLVELRMTVI